jgi:CRISPR-associated protein Cmr6
MSAATIPMPGDVAELIGHSAQWVENRSLLLDKFVFHKKWPVIESQTHRGSEIVKWDEASRWSFMRIADGAENILRREANEKRNKARGRNVEPENSSRYIAEAGIADVLAGVKWDSKDISELRSSHTRRLISLVRSAYGQNAAITLGQLEGRLAINLADSLIQNAGICLDRLLGLPFIPGSSIKGVCRHDALAALKAASGDEQSTLLTTFCEIFGTSVNDFKKGDLSMFRHLVAQDSWDRKGSVSFLPAYPVNEARVVVDLTNVHYPDYYRSGRAQDLSKEKPRPNPFPAIEAGAQFAFCIVFNKSKKDPAILRHAKGWLESALMERGLGAKVSSGYGWFSLKPEVLKEIEDKTREENDAKSARLKEEQKRIDLARREQDRRNALSPEEKAIEDLNALNQEQFAFFAKSIADKDESQQRAFIDLLRNTKEKQKRWKTWNKKKPDLAQNIRETCKNLNLPDLP